MAREHRDTLLSYADFKALPPESPGEVIEGEFVLGPSPFARHQVIAAAIMRQLANFLDDRPELGAVYIAPLDVVLRAERPAVVVQPDVLFVSAEREAIVADVVIGAPDLVVEVVSPGTVRTDAVRKRELYGRFGVQEYWLVWPEDERIDVFTRGAAAAFGDPLTVATGDRLTTPLLPGFDLVVERVFAWRRPPKIQAPAAFESPADD